MSVTIEQFFVDLTNDVGLSAGVDGTYREDAFFRIVADHLVAAGEIETHERTGFRVRGLQIDGHGGSSEEADDVLSLLVMDFDAKEQIESLTLTEIDSRFRRLTAFIKKAMQPEFRAELEESSAGFEAAIHIKSWWVRAKVVKLILISNKRLSARSDGLESIELVGKPTIFSVWDLERLWRYVRSGREREDMAIDLERDYGGPIPALPAHLGAGDYEAFLCVVPGVQLAAIYDKWGSRLLEQNVRSFLQLKGNVNKGIAKTIRETPERFFAYNNGISATAESVEMSSDGRSIARVSNLQIVNGGQTTASLNLQRNRGLSLDGIFVPMKLSIILPEIADDVVPKISECANTQNKVNAADFFANHPFHIELEKISRRMLAPQQSGSFAQTRWFYERSRGQFLNERSRLTPVGQRKFDAEWPKSQVLTKTDLAKYLNLWPGNFGSINPTSVCRGSQKNFANFAQAVGGEWSDTSLDLINDGFFRECVAKALLFREMERIVDKQPWYQGGYRAQVVAHSIAKLAWSVHQQGSSIDFEKIWTAQSVSSTVRRALVNAADVVRVIIAKPTRAGQNITEWAKQVECWEQVKEASVLWPDALATELQSVADTRAQKSAARKDKRIDAGIEIQKKVFEIGAAHWQVLFSWAIANRGSMSADELNCVARASNPRGAPPNVKQCALALQALANARARGFQG